MSTEVLPTGGVAPAGAAERPPYPPSWADRLTAAVDRLPGPAWAAYLALGLGLVAIYLVTFVASGTWKPELLPLNTFLLYSALNGLTPAYLLGLMHYLDESAAGALARFRPVLAVDDAGQHRLAYQLTTLPARPTWIAAGLGAVYTGAALLLTVLTRPDPLPIAERPVVFAVGWGFNLLLYVLVAVLVYHTLHQLRIVNTIYTRHTRINLFQRGPLYALSSLTARTAVGSGIPTYIWFQANTLTSQGIDVPNIIQTVFLGGVMILTFLWPLLGAHGLLEREKQRLQDDVGQRIEATLAALRRRAAGGDLADFAAQKGVLDGLLTEQGVIDKLRTWPWRTETISGLGLAFLLPILIWVVQRVLERSDRTPAQSRASTRHKRKSKTRPGFGFFLTCCAIRNPVPVTFLQRRGNGTLSRRERAG